MAALRRVAIVLGVLRERVTSKGGTTEIGRAHV